MPVAFHIGARSRDRRLLWRNWSEARVLWDALVRATPGRVAIALMPDHVHVVHPVDVRSRVATALSGFARWRHHARGESGPVFDQVWSEEVADEIKLRILIKYVHLNPCRAELASDPLEWPFSSHRDACGFALPPVVPQVHHVAAFHKFVSNDPYAAIGGTPLPHGAVAVHHPFVVLEAVSALTRTPLPRILKRGPARQLYLRAAFVLAPGATRNAMGGLVRVGRNAAARAAASDDGVQLVARVLSDTRFRALHVRPLEWPGKGYRF